MNEITAKKIEIVTAMRVRNMQYFHLECFLFSKNKGLLAQSAIQAVTNSIAVYKK